MTVEANGIRLLLLDGLLFLGLNLVVSGSAKRLGKSGPGIGWFWWVSSSKDRIKGLFVLS